LKSASSPVLALTGVTGFLGSRVLTAALAAGVHTRVLVREQSKIAERQGCTIIRGDLREAKPLDQLVDGAHVLIHMAAAMGSTDRTLLYEVNGASSRALFVAASRAGVGRIVLVSTMAALRPHDGPYAASKAQGQRALDSFAGTSIVLQPPLIYGRGSQVSATIAGLARFGVVPVINSTSPLYPVHVDDVAAACIEAALSDEAESGNYPLPGPEAIKFPEFTRRVLTQLGSNARIVRLPEKVSRGLCRVMEATMPRPLLTSESVNAVLQGSATSDSSAAARALGFAPRGLDQGLSSLRSR
jgi:nucleoside-diphosphate-sugar epimerase